jgi:Lon protease-like protein
VVQPLRGRVFKGAVQLRGTPPSYPLQVPLLPFPSSEVLLPGQVKTLHLYEARYLNMLEEVLQSDDKLFG